MINFTQNGMIVKAKGRGFDMTEVLKGVDALAFGKYFDHTLLKAYAPRSDFDEFCREGIRHNVKMLAINPAAVVYCKEKVKDCGVKVGAAIGFPLGQMTLETKIFETRDAIQKGADEIDYVIDLVNLKSRNYDSIKDEMEAIVSICREKNVVSKVIFENCYLTDDEKKFLCETANVVKPDFIKTSTGFGSGGATLADVKLMSSYAFEEIEIKASGGIKTLDCVIKLLEAGATRIGTSSTVAIIDEYRAALDSVE